jgi:predicted metal-dependent HD superfamily phosphohydrolase
MVTADAAGDRELADDGVALLLRTGAEPIRVRPLVDRVIDAHRGPHRYYHTTEHLQVVLGVVDDLADLADAPDTVRLAAWFHDLVYDPTRHDNETASADHARVWLGDVGVPPDVVEEVGRLVELTAHHRAEPEDGNGLVLVDADLAILGATPSDYDRYVAAVRAEYGHLDDRTWREGRTAVLRTFLHRSHVFGTDRMRHELDERARVNLSRELQTLSGDGDPTP